jgi:DNA-binding IscR family transcriptional regulator
MTVSKMTTYAIIALHELEAAGDKPVPMARLAEVLSAASGNQVSMLSVQQVMLKPLKGGIVSSVRGPNGGYVLSRKLSKVSVYDVAVGAGPAKRPVVCGGRTLLQTVADTIDVRVAMALKKLKVGELKIKADGRAAKPSRPRTL